MTIQDRKEQRKFLRHGDQALLARLAGVGQNVVYRWIEGLQEDSVIEPYFVRLVAQRKAEIEEKFKSL